MKALMKENDLFDYNNSSSKKESTNFKKGDKFTSSGPSNDNTNYHNKNRIQKVANFI